MALLAVGAAAAYYLYQWWASDTSDTKSADASQGEKKFASALLRPVAGAVSAVVARQPQSIAKTKIKIVRGDITKQRGVDAIVNAANCALLGGSGVDGAIHGAAGKELADYCRQNVREISKGVRCPVGEAVCTPSFGLTKVGIQHIIHTVGPNCGVQEINRNRKVLLEKAYRSCLNCGVQNGITAIAFPSISTGIYKYPLQEGAQVALETTRDFLQTSAGQKIREVRFVLFDSTGLSAYQTAYARL